MLKKNILNLLNCFSPFNKYFSGIATIFMLHRVSQLEDDKLFSNENMKISPEFLEKIILELIDKKYEFISLDRLFQILCNNEKFEKQIVFTLDDGYLDNYTNAFPVFKKYNVPFTIYLTTGFIQEDVSCWWYDIEDIIRANELIVFEDEVLICRTVQEKEEVFMYLREILISKTKEELSKTLDKFISLHSLNSKVNAEKLFMDWSQVKELSRDHLVTLGSHTSTHHAMNRLSKLEIIEDITNSNALIEAEINKKVTHFAYPFGSRNEVGEKEFEIIKNLNFATATTTRPGTIFNKHVNYLECLPRIMLTENFNIKSMNGIRRRRVVTD